MNSRKLALIVAVMMTSAGVYSLSALHAADDEKPARPSKAEPANAESVATLEKEWDSLVDERNKVSKKLLVIQEKGGALEQQRQALLNGKETPSPKDKPKVDAIVKQQLDLQKEYIALVSNFQKKSMSRMEELLPTLAKAKYSQFIKNPKDDKAKTIIEEYIQMIFHGKHRYEDVANFGQKVIATGRATPLITNLTGAALFNTNQFDKAIEVLKAAEKDTTPEGREIFEGIGARCLTESTDYIPLWKREDALRKAEAAAPKEEQNPHVLLKTTKGDIEIELFENQAPNAVANFIHLIEEGKYNGVGFHRVLPNFMAQGGDPNTLDDNPNNDGAGGPGYTIKCECKRKDARMHFRGTLSMAHAGPNTGGSQFFITYVPTSHLNNLHTAFGRVVKGMDVATSFAVGEPVPQNEMDKIVSAKVLSKRDHDYIPETTPDPRSGKK